MAGTAQSGWAAGDARLFVGAPWVISVDDHVDPDVWTMVVDLALDCGAVVVPARSDEHDAAAAAHLAPAAPAGRGARGHRRRGAAGVRAGGGLVPGRHPGRGDRAGSGARDVRGNTEQLLPALDRAHRAADHARDALAANGSVAELVDERPRRPDALRQLHPAEIVTTVIGADNWREELAAAGRAGGVIRSALPVLGSRG